MTAARFTVIVPSYGRPDRLLECLRSIDSLIHRRFDVIVSDDGSPDPLEPIVQRERWTHDVSVIAGPNRGSGAARNRAAREARGELLAFTADDCSPRPDWLDRLDDTFREPDFEHALIGGAIDHALPHDLCATASHLLIDYLTSTFNRESPRFFTPNNLAVHAGAFAESGGFDDLIGSTGEDREFCGRWIQQGRRIGFASRAVVSHAHPLSLSAYLRQQASYGRGSTRSRRRSLGREGPRVPMPLSFYTRLVTHPFRVEPPHRAAPLMGLMIIGQVANAWGAIRARHEVES